MIYSDVCRIDVALISRPSNSASVMRHGPTIPHEEGSKSSLPPGRPISHSTIIIANIAFRSNTFWNLHTQMLTSESSTCPTTITQFSTTPSLSAAASSPRQESPPPSWHNEGRLQWTRQRRHRGVYCHSGALQWKRRHGAGNISFILTNLTK